MGSECARVSQKPLRGRHLYYAQSGTQRRPTWSVGDDALYVLLKPNGVIQENHSSDQEIEIWLVKPKVNWLPAVGCVWQAFNSSAISAGNCARTSHFPLSQPPIQSATISGARHCSVILETQRRCHLGILSTTRRALICDERRPPQH